jgi:hypothetical protein
VGVGLRVGSLLKGVEGCEGRWIGSKGESLTRTHDMALICISERRHDTNVYTTTRHNGHWHGDWS